MRKIFVKFFLATLFITTFFACGEEQQQNQNRKLNIVATTGMIADALQNIAGDRAEVTSLMGPGVDPHLYKATQGDLGKLRSADIIFYNGLHLEGKMGEVLERLARQKPVVAVAEKLPENRLLANPDYADSHDPHVWFDVSLWSEAVAFASHELQKHDTANAEYYQQNTNKYIKELSELHQWVKEQIAIIPEEQRVLITAHDAFEYFGRAYKIEVRGLQGISTVAEYGLQDISQMVKYLVENNIKAVFVESSVSEKALEAVVQGTEKRGHHIIIGGTLYSDAMGKKGTAEGTYNGMVRHNVNTIVHALK